MIIVYIKESDTVNLVEKITSKQIRTDIPEFRVGDTVKVNVKIVEGKRERIQAFEGLVISRRPSGLRKTSFIVNSLAHRTTWLRSDFVKWISGIEFRLRRRFFGLFKSEAKRS